MDFHKLLNDVLNGFIIIGRILLWLVLFASILVGTFGIVVVAAGELPFSWWYVPCWIVILIIIAEALGEVSKKM